MIILLHLICAHLYQKVVRVFRPDKIFLSAPKGAYYLRQKMLIEINLLPENLRTRKIKGISFSAEDTLAFVLIGVGLLIAINIFFFIIGFILRFNVNLLDKKFLRLKPDIQKMQALETQLKQSQAKASLVEGLTSERILWSEKLQIISELIPQGVWLNSMTAKEGKFNIEASCVSLKGKEMDIISQFINALKNKTAFFDDFDKLELVSVNRRAVSTIEVVDFSLAGNIKK